MKPSTLPTSKTSTWLSAMYSMALDRLRLADNTLVLFSSDNGPETLKRYSAGTRCYGSPGPPGGMKLCTTDGGLRVPGIVRWPGHAPAGTTCDEPIGSLDLLPALAALAEAKVPPTNGT